MNFTGFILGICSFLIIGIFHPIVVKAEYYFSEKIWPAFLLAGLIFIVLSFVIQEIIPSSLLGILGFTCLWSIKEVKEQTQRVAKGWADKNPNRKIPY